MNKNQDNQHCRWCLFRDWYRCALKKLKVKKFLFLIQVLRGRFLSKYAMVLIFYKITLFVVVNILFRTPVNLLRLLRGVVYFF